MPGTKEIKSHMDSVGETRKITNAMYLIASTKLQRARQELEHTRPYFEALRGEIKRIFRTAYQSVASVAIFQVQDVLHLGNEARTNEPSTTGNNWKWRLYPGQLTYQEQGYLKRLVWVFRR